MVARWVAASPERASWLRAITTQSRTVARTPDLDPLAMTARLQARLAAEVRRPAFADSEVHTARTPTRSPGRVPGIGTRGLARMRVNSWIVAATLCVVTGGVFWLARGWSAATSTREFVTRTGEQTTLRLVDGTRVVLGPSSRLWYSNTNTRDVTLDHGVAYFDVVHDPAHPFIVHAADAVAEELGTAFSVSASTRDTTVRVVVANGRVMVRPANAMRTAGVLLSRGDLGEVHPVGDAESRVTRRRVDLAVALAWVEGRLVFDRTPMRDVLAALEARYDVSFTVSDSSLLSERVSGPFQGDALHDILAQLAAVSDLDVTQSGTRVVLSRTKRPSARP